MANPVNDYRDRMSVRGRIGPRQDEPPPRFWRSAARALPISTVRSDRLVEPTLASPVPTSVYRYYDDHSVLLYVGVTSRGMQRNREHNTTKEWWQFVMRQEVDHLASREEALARERDLIVRHHPPFNKQHNPDHEATRAAYLLFAALPNGDHKSIFGGVEASRKARQLITGLSHRLPLTKVKETDRLVTYSCRPEHIALAACINFANVIPLCNPTKTGTFKRTTKEGARIHFVFERDGERKTPMRAALKLRVTQKPMTIWAHKAEAA